MLISINVDNNQFLHWVI